MALHHLVSIGRDLVCRLRGCQWSLWEDLYSTKEIEVCDRCGRQGRVYRRGEHAD